MLEANYFKFDYFAIGLQLESFRLFESFVFNELVLKHLRAEYSFV
jgi:hypothetical protein